MANEFRKVIDTNNLVHPVCDDNRVDWSSYAKTGVHNIAKSYKAETYTEQYYRALNIDMDLQPSTTYNFILDLPNSGNEYYFNDSLFAGGDTITADGTKKVVARTTKSTLDNSQYNLANGGWYILKNAMAQSSAPAFTGVAVCDGSDTSDEITPYSMTNSDLTPKALDITTGDSDNVELQSNESRASEGIVTLRCLVHVKNALTSQNVVLIEADRPHPNYGCAVMVDGSNGNMIGLIATSYANKVRLVNKGNVAAGWYNLTYTYSL